MAVERVLVKQKKINKLTDTNGTMITAAESETTGKMTT